MKDHDAGSGAVDEARDLVAENVTALLSDGHLELRIRLPASGDRVWFYGHRDNEWHKVSEVPCDAQTVAAVREQLGGLASRPHIDGLNVRQHSKPDWSDTDLRFSRETIEEHLGANLQSYLYGLLYYDHRDSGKDIRRRIQRGPRFNQ